MGNQKKSENKKPLKNPNSIREFEACLTISTQALLRLFVGAGNSQKHRNAVSNFVQNSFEEYITDNIDIYLGKNDNIALAGFANVNITGRNNEFGRDENITARIKKGIWQNNGADFYDAPEVDGYFPQALYLTKEGKNIVTFKDGRSAIEIMQSKAFWENAFKETSHYYKSTSDVEKSMSREFINSAQEKLTQINQALISKGTSVINSDRNWFLLISNYVQEYSKLTTENPNVAEKDIKYRTLALYLYLKAKSDNPEDDFSSREALYKYVATVVGSTSGSVKQYILALGKDNIEYKSPEHFEKAKQSLLSEFERATQPIKEKVAKQVGSIRHKK